MTRPHQAGRIVGAAGLIAALILAGCTAGSSSPSPSQPTASASAAATIEASASASATAVASPSQAASVVPSEPTESLIPFACSPSVSITATTERAQITDVRVGTHPGYDRVVFHFAAGIPQTTIDAVLPPFYRDASGEPLTVAGTHFLKITMHGGTKVTPDGGITYSGPTSFEPGLDQIVQLIEGGDFEAVSTWYLGLDQGGCIRVLTLSAPSRLVIDIEH
jgi:hypothetical protein